MFSGLMLFLDFLILLNFPPSFKMDSEDVSTTNIPNTSTVVNPKPIIRKPRNILRQEHLTSKKGIALLPEVIGGTKFKGKGHELEDLKLLLFKTKHWAHRLFPALTFEDFIDFIQLF